MPAPSSQRLKKLKMPATVRASKSAWSLQPWAFAASTWAWEVADGSSLTTAT